MKSQADIARKARMALILRGTGDWSRHPHPGQRYKHGWVPLHPAELLGTEAARPAEPAPPSAARRRIPFIFDAADIRDDYRPGEWQGLTGEVTSERDIQRWHDGLRAMAARDPSSDYARASDYQLRLWAEDRASMDPGSVLYVNGEHEIRNFANVRFDVLGAADVLDRLQQRYPTGRPVRVGVKDTLARPDGAGQYVNGSGEILLAARHLSRDEDRLGDAGKNMPAKAVTPQLEYTIAHEWGHMLTDTAEARGIDISDLMDAPDMSEYGRTNRAEFLAEAFAEWFLTEGQTTNATVREVARRFGW